MPERIQLRRTKGWRKPPRAVVVARPSRWGNPFRIYHGHTSIGPAWSVARETWGHIPTPECDNAYVTSSTPMGADEAVRLYRALLTVRARDEVARLAKWLTPLAGRDLACWCPLDQPCHADVLLALANGQDADG